MPNFSGNIANTYFSFQNSTRGYYGTGINSTSTPVTSSFVYEFNPFNNNWLPIQNLPGNHFSGGTFSFQNNSFVMSGLQYYSPHSIAINSTWQYKPSIQVTAIEHGIVSENNIKIYPNPVKNILTLEVDPSYLGMNYRIVDVLGREVIKGTINEQINQINLQDLVPGIYILFGEKESIKYKIVKE